MSLENALFYNSVNGDRIYDADSFEYLLKKFFTTGVFSGDCAVSAASGMGIQISSGYCNIDGKVKVFQSPVSLTLTNANPSYDRIDTVVIERNDTDRVFTAKVITGSASASPVPTAPVRTAGIYQIVLAEVYVAAGAVSISQANITDKRPDSSVCGIVCAAVQTPDFSDLYAQFTEAFGVWFDRMKGQLSTDAAGNLQNEIDELDNEVVKNTAQTLTAGQKAQARLNIGSNPIIRWSMHYPQSMGSKDYITAPVSHTETGYDCYAIYCTALMQTDIFAQLVMQNASPSPNEAVVYIKNNGSSAVTPSLTVLWICIPKNQ